VGVVFKNQVTSDNRGCIDIVKQVQDANGDPLQQVPAFTFTINGSFPVQNDSTGRARYVNVPPGNYVIGEQVLPGWQLQQVSPPLGAVTVSAGSQCAVVTFLNRQVSASSSSSFSSFSSSFSSSSFSSFPSSSSSSSFRSSVSPNLGCIEILKEAFNPNNQELSVVPPFTFRLNGSDPRQNNTNGFLRYDNLQPGTYTLTEELPAGWMVLSVTPQNGLITVTPGPQCAGAIFKNRQLPASSSSSTSSFSFPSSSSSSSSSFSSSSSLSSVSPQFGCIEVRKEAYNPQNVRLSVTPQFQFRLDNQFVVHNDSQGLARYVNVPTGLHTVTETVPPGWTNFETTPANGVVFVRPGSSCAQLTFKNRQVLPGPISSSSSSSSAFSSVPVPPPPPPSPILGCIEIRKQAFNAASKQLSIVPQFTFQRNGGSPIQNNAAGFARYDNIAPGTYVITENFLSGWNLIGVNPSGGVVTVSSGPQCALVTFQNRQQVQSSSSSSSSPGGSSFIWINSNANTTVDSIINAQSNNSVNVIQSGNGQQSATVTPTATTNVDSTINAGSNNSIDVVQFNAPGSTQQAAINANSNTSVASTINAASNNDVNVAQQNSGPGSASAVVEPTATTNVDSTINATSGNNVGVYQFGEPQQSAVQPTQNSSSSAMNALLQSLMLLGSGAGGMAFQRLWP
jgi:hypothetical protein